MLLRRVCMSPLGKTIMTPRRLALTVDQGRRPGPSAERPEPVPSSPLRETQRLGTIRDPKMTGQETLKHWKLVIQNHLAYMQELSHTKPLAYMQELSHTKPLGIYAGA